MNTIYGYAIMRLVEYDQEHPLLATLESWEEEGLNLADYDTAVLLAQHLACGNLPYPVVLRLSEYLAATLEGYGDERFRKVFDMGIDHLGVNAINRVCQVGREMVVQTALVYLTEPEKPHLAFRLYAAFPNTSASDFAAWVELVYPEADYKIQEIAPLTLRRIPFAADKVPHAVEWEFKL